MEIERTIHSLKTNPLFWMSASSKETYHSNLMAWLLENFASQLSRLFGRYEQVQREYKIGKKAVDIALLSSRGLEGLVEIKVKDYFDVSQAKQYDICVPHKYLLHMFDNESIEGWTSIRFQDVATALKDARASDSDKQAIINMYIRLMFDLHELQSFAPPNPWFEDLDGEYYVRLREIRMGEAWRKHAGAQIIRRLTSDGLKSDVSISNTQVTMTMSVDVGRSTCGVQIEGHQFRRFVMGYNDEQTKLLNSGWFSRDWKQRNGGNFCTYNMRDKGCFYYQYKEVSRAATPNEVRDSVSKIIAEAVRILQQ